MKVIDLLNKIANGEEVPKKIKYENYIYEYEEKYLDYQKIGSNMDICLFEHHSNFILNYEVEIIEEDKEIEQIEFDEIDEMTNYDIYFYPECGDDSKENFKEKINELIRNQKKIIKAVKELKKGKQYDIRRNKKRIIKG